MAHSTIPGRSVLSLRLHALRLLLIFVWITFLKNYCWPVGRKKGNAYFSHDNTIHASKEINIILRAIAKQSTLFVIVRMPGLQSWFFFPNAYMMLTNCMVRPDNIKWSDVFVLPPRRVINSKISLSLMSLYGYTYAYITGETTFLEIYYLPDNHLWASWTHDSTIKGVLAVKCRIKNLADHLSVSTCFLHHQVVFLFVCVQFRNG